MIKLEFNSGIYLSGKSAIQKHKLWRFIHHTIPAGKSLQQSKSKADTWLGGLSLSNSVVHSHWSRLNEARLSLVEMVQSVATPVSLMPCTEKSYNRRPYAIQNQRGASKKPLVGDFGCNELVLYGIRVLAEQHHEAFEQ